MSIFNEFKSRLQSEKKTIVFTEGEDLRIQAAAERLTQDESSLLPCRIMM